MFDDLNPENDPVVGADALERVATRTRQMRVRRRLLAAAAAIPAVIAIAASIAVAAPGARHDTVHVVAPTTTLGVDESRHHPHTTTTTSTTTTVAPTRTTVTTVGSPDTSTTVEGGIAVTVSPSSLDLVQGGSAPVTITVTNHSSVAQTVDEPPCPSVYLDPKQACYRIAPRPVLAAGASLRYTVTVYAGHLVAGAITAVPPGDYDAVINYGGGNPSGDQHVAVHVRAATSGSPSTPR